MIKENDEVLVYIVNGAKSSLDKDLNPFSAQLRIKMFKDLFKDSINVVVIKSGWFINDLESKYKNLNDEFTLYCGSDRLLSYSKFKSKLNLQVKEIPRNNGISATKLRCELRVIKSDLAEPLLNPIETNFEVVQYIHDINELPNFNSRIIQELYANI